MEWLNYHHLLYFWVTAREGSVTAAAQRLHVAQPTISGQIRALEKSLGKKLWERKGRGVQLTDSGRLAYSFAERIFPVGQDLLQAMHGQSEEPRASLRVGHAESVPRAVAAALLEPTFSGVDNPRLQCRHAAEEELLRLLEDGHLDLVISAAPAGPGHSRLTSHPLGDSPTAFFAVERLARRYRRGFPASLDSAPMLLPLAGSPGRRSLDSWLERRNLQPRVVGEFQDTALLKVFGQRGVGVFPAPAALAKEVQRQYQVKQVGVATNLRESLFLITGPGGFPIDDWQSLLAHARSSWRIPPRTPRHKRGRRGEAKA